MRLQGIMVAVFIILDWIFVLMNAITVIPCRRVPKREFGYIKISTWFQGLGNKTKEINFLFLDVNGISFVLFP